MHTVGWGVGLARKVGVGGRKEWWGKGLSLHSCSLAMLPEWSHPQPQVGWRRARAPGLRCSSAGRLVPQRPAWDPHSQASRSWCSSPGSGLRVPFKMLCGFYMTATSWPTACPPRCGAAALSPLPGISPARAPAAPCPAAGPRPSTRPCISKVLWTPFQEKKMMIFSWGKMWSHWTLHLPM